MASTDFGIHELTRYPETARALALQCQEAAVDHDAFDRPLPLCQLASCRATCCHDGVVLSSEEASLIGEGIQELPDGRFKTQTVCAPDHLVAEDFPEHFPRTRCVFLDDQHRCKWQLRSVEEGRYPWYYKPVSCWMHPVLLTRKEGRPFLTIVAPGHDQQGFASCTPCGALGEGSDPARVTLKGELEMLSRLSGRAFLRELNASAW